MVEKETVFVLGAGSSITYGFPSGFGLRQKLLTTEALEGLIVASRSKFESRDIEHFYYRFRDSSLDSIDSFLGKQNGPNAKFVEIGKFAIAYVLCAHENPAAVRSVIYEQDWYRYLWNCLAREIASPDEIHRNRVKFITFNYDRSLEHFLYERLLATFAISDDQALAIVRKLAILHVYGSLGRFGISVSGTDLPYQPTHNTQSLLIAANAIRVIPEARDDSDEFKTAREWLSHAERICFLGFGFDSLNVRRLGILNGLSRPTSYENVFGVTAPDFFATVRGKSPGQANTIQERLGVADDHWHLSSDECRDALLGWGLLD